MDPEELKKKAEAEAAAAAAAKAGNTSGEPNKPGSVPGADDAATLKKKLDEAEAKVAAADAARVKAEAESQKRIKELSDEAAKYRVAKNDQEKKAKADADAALAAQGQYAVLFEGKKAEADALAREKDSLALKAAKLDAIEMRQRAELDAAKAEGKLPSFVVKAIDAAIRAGEIDSAHEVLSDYRSQTQNPAGGGKPASTPSTPLGAAPSTPAPSKPIELMTTAELNALAANPEAWAKATGGRATNGEQFDPLQWMASRGKS